MAVAARTKIQVSVVSDTVCPWCFVGKKRLEAAMSRLSARNVDFEVRWYPFQLNPNAPLEGEDKLTMYNQKFGPARVASMLPMMTQTFAQLGYKYSIGGKTGNTFDSHRLIHFAGEVGGASLQNALVEELFLNYFTEEKYINDREVLLAAAEKVGLQGAAEYLANPENGRAEVKALLASKTRNINGVPHFTIDNMYSLSGAQDPATFQQIFEGLLQERERDAAAAAGKAQAAGAACDPKTGQCV